MNIIKLIMHRASGMSTVGIVLFSFLLSGCTCNNITQSTHWLSNGNAVFNVLSQCAGFDTKETHHLMLYTNNLKKKKEILRGVFFDLSVSPNGEDVLVVKKWEGKDIFSRSLHQINEKSSKLIKNFHISYPMDIGWSESGDYYYYSDGTGITGSSLSDNHELSIVKGEFYGIAWSPVRKQFAYRSGKGWRDGNSLYLLNTNNGESKEIYLEPKGLIEHGFFSIDGNTFIITTRDYANDTSKVLKLDLETNQVSEIYKLPTEDIFSFRIHPTKKPDSILLWASDKLMLLDLSTGQTQLIKGLISRDLWDYDPSQNKILFSDNAGNPKTLELIFD